MADAPTAVITRPAEDAAPLAATLATRGWLPMLEPLLAIDYAAGPAPDLNGTQALLFTSANGVRAFARLTPERHCPVFAVGPATARAATEAGFGHVTTAGGDVTALAAQVAEDAVPADGALLHIAGTVTAGDLSGALQTHGFTVRRLPLYAARQADHLSPAFHTLWQAGRASAVLAFSPRTARTLVALLAAAGVVPGCRQARAVCLSTAVADALRGSAEAPLPWHAIDTAATPTQDALLDLMPAVG